jgi:hypothetical protein
MCERTEEWCDFALFFRLADAESLDRRDPARARAYL